jgi:phage shock protein C
MIWGIIGGVGEYFDVDPTILRLGYVVVTLITGTVPGVIAYIIAYFIIPERPMNTSRKSTDYSQQKEKETPTQEKKEDKNTESSTSFTKAETHTPSTYPDVHDAKPELKALGVTHESKERYMPGERPVEEYATELTVPEENDQGLKKPQWPAMDSLKSKVESKKEKEPTTATLDSLLETERDVDLDDIVDE